MTKKGVKYIAVPRQLTKEDKEFIKMLGAGVPKSVAFRAAYPNQMTVKRYEDVVKSDATEATRRRARELVIMAAKHKLQTQYMQKAITTYQSRMDKLADIGLDVAEDLMLHGRSEMVKADLAKEFVRHKVGSPTTKVAVAEKKEVIITFGVPPGSPGTAANQNVVDVDADF